MGREIERKYLLRNQTWRGLGKPELYRQGYLSTDKDRTVRVRIVGELGILTIKGPATNGERLEYEYPIPHADAVEMLDQLSVSGVVEKYRHKIEYGGFVWEVDEFTGENEGLILAEIELEHVGQDFAIPPWIGREVSSDPRYYNSYLSKVPYSTWKDD